MLHIHSTGTRRSAALLIVLAIAWSFIGVEKVRAQSSWSPTLLVNTEAFQTIDDGDGSSNIELRFGASTKTLKFLTTNKFQFSHALSVLGNISGSSLRVDGLAEVHGPLAVSGAVRADSNLTINDDQTAADAVFTFGSDGTNETLSFLNTADRFQFSDDVSVVGYLSGSALRVDGLAEIHGALTASGAVRTDSNLTINDDQTAADAVFTFGSDGTNETLSFLNTADKFQFSDDVSVVGYLSGSALRVDGLAEIHGALAASGAIRTDSDLTLNDDLTATDVALTFGSDGTSETISWLNTADKFSFSDDIRVLGNISGSTLTVDGNLTLHGITYAFPTAQGGANTFLKNDGAGNLTWDTSSVGDGSGGILSLHPEFPNAVYFSSGSAFVGQLTLSGGTSALDNSYVWTSSQSGIQDYWTSIRVRLPDNFSAWDPSRSLQLRYKTGNASAAVNHLTVRIKDTTGASIALTGGGALASTSWTTADITGPAGSGTWTPGGYITIYIKAATTSSGNAAIGFLNLNFETTTP